MFLQFKNDFDLIEVIGLPHICTLPWPPIVGGEVGAPSPIVRFATLIGNPLGYALHGGVITQRTTFTVYGNWSEKRRVSRRLCQKNEKAILNIKFSISYRDKR